MPMVARSFTSEVLLTTLSILAEVRPFSAARPFVAVANGMLRFD